MNKHHFIDVLRRRQLADAGIKPRPDWWIATLAIFLTLFFVLITADFKNALGTNKDTLHAVAILLTWGALVATVALFVWWVVYLCTKHPQKTPEQEYAEIVKMMEEDEQKLTEIQSAAQRAARQTSTDSSVSQ